MLQMPFCQHPEPSLWTGGQPTLQDIPELVKLGIRTVIDLRAAEEPRPFPPEPTWAAHGITYVALPVRGVPDLNPTRAKELEDAVAQAEPGVLVHCASANRVGALFACAQVWLHGQGPEDAALYGRERGLKQMEGLVRSLWGATGP